MTRDEKDLVDKLRTLEAELWKPDMPTTLFNRCGCGSPLLLIPGDGGYYTRRVGVWIIHLTPPSDSPGRIGVSAFWESWSPEPFYTLEMARQAHADLAARVTEARALGGNVVTPFPREGASIILEGDVIPLPRR